MRLAFFSVAIGIVAACAASSPDERPEAPPPDGDDGGVLPVLDASSDAPVDARQEPARCSEAGWCLTTLLDSDFSFQDIWPLRDRAFAVGQSSASGTQVLEWDGAQWAAVDDNVLNAEGQSVVTSVWAPNESEVYVAMYLFGAIFDGGKFGSLVFHGRRPSTPEAKWTWTKDTFTCPRLDNWVQVWGSSAEDVHVVSCRRAFQKSADGEGGAPWTVEYTDEEPSPMEIVGITGTAPDDLWLVGARGSPLGGCAVLVHKTAEGYRRIADGTVKGALQCDPKPGFLTIPGAVRTFHSPRRETFVGARYTTTVDNDLVRLAPQGDGSFSLVVSSPAATMDVNLTSIWGTSDDDLWLLATRAAAGGGILRGKDLWADAGSFQYSTLALNGAPNTQRLVRIRGTSNTNLWAVGAERAYHKTTP